MDNCVYYIVASPCAVAPHSAASALRVVIAIILISRLEYNITEGSDTRSRRGWITKERLNSGVFSFYVLSTP